MSRLLLGTNPATELLESFEAADLVKEASARWQPGTYHGNGAANATYVLVPGMATLADLANFTSLAMFRFDPARFEKGKGILQVKLVVDYMQNSTAPGSGRTFTPGLYPVLSANTANAALDLQGVTLAAAAISNPAAGDENKVESAWVDAPAAGQYAFGGVQAGGSVAAGAYTTMVPELLVRRSVAS